MPLVDPSDEKLWQSWTDVLGNEYGPGDYIAYASINDKSPQLVVGMVVKINRVDSSGNLVRKRIGRWSDETFVDSCTVTVQPVLDARGFHRGGQRWSRDLHQFVRTKPNKVTMRIPENIIKIDWKPPTNESEQDG